MLTQQFRLTRDVTKKECSWLDRNYKKGEILFEYDGYTYGCISPNGIACSDKDQETPFYEIPKNALERI